MAEGITLQDLSGAAASARKATGRASRLKAGENTVGDLLKERVQDAYNYNEDLVGRLDEQTGEYYSAPATAREQYQDIFNPFQREKLVSQYVSNQMTPMLGTANILGGRMGRIDDLIGSGTRAYEAQSAAAQGQATLESQAYQDLMDQYKLQQEQSRWEQEYALDVLKAQQDGAGSGAGGLEWLRKNILPFTSGFELSSSEQERYNKWSNALKSIQNIKAADDSTFRKAALGGTGFFGQALRGITGNDQSRALRKDIENIQDALARYRSGAALNPEEQQFYERFIKGDPVDVVRNYRAGSDRAMEILTDIANKEIDPTAQKKQMYDFFTGTIRSSLMGDTGADAQGRPPLSSFDIGY